MPSQAPFAQLSAPVFRPNLDHNHALANQYKTYHAVEIVVNDKVIGGFSSWNVSALGRDITRVKQLGRGVYGTVGIVPGAIHDLTITGTKVEIWDQETSIQFGFDTQAATLADHRHPFEVIQYLWRGDEVYRAWLYAECWFSSIGVGEWSADGSYVVNSDFTIECVTRIPII